MLREVSRDSIPNGLVGFKRKWETDKMIVEFMEMECEAAEVVLPGSVLTNERAWDSFISSLRTEAGKCGYRVIAYRACEQVWLVNDNAAYGD